MGMRSHPQPGTVARPLLVSEIEQASDLKGRFGALRVSELRAGPGWPGSGRLRGATASHSTRRLGEPADKVGEQTRRVPEQLRAWARRIGGPLEFTPRHEFRAAVSLGETG